MRGRGVTLKKALPWLQSRASDWGLFLLYSAYMPNSSSCNRGGRRAPELGLGQCLCLCPTLCVQSPTGTRQGGSRLH